MATDGKGGSLSDRGQHRDDQSPASNNGQRSRLHDPRSRTPMSCEEAHGMGRRQGVSVPPVRRGADES